MYLTAKEYKEHWGGFKEKKEFLTKPLPFYCCCLSMQPFKVPYCMLDGFVFDIEEIVPWIKEKGCHPLTGKKVSLKDFIRLEFSKNIQGKFKCPVTDQVFNEHTHIVAVRLPSNKAHVYSYTAVKKFNFPQGKTMTDLIEDDPFTKADIIHIQNPNDMKKRSLSHFIRLKDDDEDKGKKLNAEMSSIIKNVNKAIEEDGENSGFRLKKRKPEDDGDQPKKKKKYYSKIHTTGSMAMSLTSSIAEPCNKVEYKELSEEEVRKIRCNMVKGTGRKAYVRFTTTHGKLNFVLHCDLVPQTCHNFLLHVENETYDNTVFHRNLPSFMIQGGDPTNSGHGGACFWGGKLKDEFNKTLRHGVRGTLSMANNGSPNTGGSQFFITYGSDLKELDEKYCVFGELVGGNDVLNKMELEKEEKAVRLIKAFGYKNPFHDPLPQEQEEIDKKKEKEKEERDAELGQWWTDPGSTAAAMMDQTVGKYLKKRKAKKKKKKRSKLGLPEPKNEAAKLPKKKKGQITRFDDFVNLGWKKKKT